MFPWFGTALGDEVLISGNGENFHSIVYNQSIVKFPCRTILSIHMMMLAKIFVIQIPTTTSNQHFCAYDSNLSDTRQSPEGCRPWPRAPSLHPEFPSIGITPCLQAAIISCPSRPFPENRQFLDLLPKISILKIVI